MNPLSPIPEHCADRAKVRLSRRASGWWDWYLITCLGEEIEGGEYEGTEKLKEKARENAQAARDDYHRSLKAKPVAYIPKDRGYLKAVCGN